jgi:hypothetical protein
LLQGSVLQSELLVADTQFVRLFPSITGQGFFLIDVPREQMADVERTLERALDRFSFDAARTSRRLAEFLAVRNTYLSTFQSLGGSACCSERPASRSYCCGTYGSGEESCR